MVSLIPNIQMSSILSWLFIALIVLLVVGGLGWYIWRTVQKRKFSQYSVEILDSDGLGNPHKTFDRAGVFLNKKTGQVCLWLEKHKGVGLNPNKIPWVPAEVGKGKQIRVVTLRKIGVNNYVYVNIRLGESVNMTLGEEDLNTYHNETIKIRRTYNKEGWLSKLAPYITVVVGMVILMILMLNLGNKFTIMEKISENMLEVAKTQTLLMDKLVKMTNSTIEQEKLDAGLPIVTPAGGIK